MVSRSLAQKKSWNIARNASKNLMKDNNDGRMFREAFYNLTGKKQYTEKSFERMTETGDYRKYGVRALRKDIALAKREHEKRMRKAYNRSKKNGNKASYAEFKRANRPLEEDIEEIRESFNSP